MSSFRQFLTFCSLAWVCIDPFAADEDDFIWFVAWLFEERRVVYTTACKYLSATRAMLAEYGVSLDWKAWYKLRKVLFGYKKLLHPPRKKKLPITTALLRLIAASFTYHSLSYDQKVMWDALLLGVFLLLRCGEITVPSLRQAADAPKIWQLNRGSSSHSSALFSLFLPKSKTDLWSHGVNLSVWATVGGPICPAAACERVLARQRRSSFLFELESGKPLCRKQLVDQIRGWILLTDIGIPVDKFAGHSMRIGGAQSLIEAGAAKDFTAILGRWALDSVDGYQAIPDSDLKSAQAAMCSVQSVMPPTSEKIPTLLSTARPRKCVMGPPRSGVFSSA